MQNVTAADFTVELRAIPDLNVPVAEYKALLWHWIETHLAA
jgi:hypothetical protein